MGTLSRRRAVYTCVLLTIMMLVMSVSPGSAGAGLSPRSAASALAPSLPGAPFLPSLNRTDLVLERLDILTELDETLAAERNLHIRLGVELASAQQAVRGDGVVPAGPELPGSGNTARILESRVDSLERELAAVELRLTALHDETAEYNMAVAVFPVASLRKPFFNDWGRPRSGGRTHKGTDLLAQTGVELRAIEDGYVERTTTSALGGLSIYLVGDSGSRYYYAHLDTVLEFEENERVYAGEQVGTIGDTGNARGAPHLHMQWSPTGDSNWQNPFPLLDMLYGEGAAAEALAAIDEVPNRDPSNDLWLD